MSVYGVVFMYAECEFIREGDPVFEPVTFIIPAHNEAELLQQTLAAIQLAIDETEIVAEIIVVNDASDDETGAISRDMGAKTIDVALRNIGAVRNAGARAARHDWLVFVDADTLLPVETLRQTLQALAHGDVGGGARVIITEEKPLFWFKRWMYLAVVIGWQIVGGWAAGCFMFCRKPEFDSFGGFDEDYFAAEELFFSRQLKQRGRFRLVQAPVITSARKLHRYSTWQLMKFVGTPLLNIRNPLQTKTGLEILYEDRS